MNVIDKEYERAIQYINAIPQFMKNTGVDRGRVLLKLLKNPQNKLKIIHVAGTNGKGSVCAYMEAVLRGNGYSTGLFTSPHLFDERERIRICGEWIDKKAFVRCFKKVKAADEMMGGNALAYFDYFFGIAMLIYSELQLDYCVIETGLGGRLDITNAVEKPVLSIITTISLEHTKILGDSVTAIAKEKAGIIKKDVPVVVMGDILENPIQSIYQFNYEACAVFEEMANKIGTKFIIFYNKDCTNIKIDRNHIDFSIFNEYYRNDYVAIKTIARYQVNNCGLALTALGVLGIQLEDAKTRKALSCAEWSGRMECIGDAVYIDGAHNPEGIKSLIETIKYIDKKYKVLLFSVVSDKDYTEMIRQLCSCKWIDEYIITGINSKRRLDIDLMKQAFYENGSMVTVIEDIKSALNYAMKQKKALDGALICSGSLYLVGEIKKEINLLTT